MDKSVDTLVSDLIRDPERCWMFSAFQRQLQEIRNLPVTTVCNN